jgi:hypothetical protein
LIFGGIKLEKENNKWISSSQVITVNTDREDYDFNNMMRFEDGKESPDFFYDNQSFQVNDTRGKKPILTTYVLGRSIYRITHDGEAYKVIRHAHGYVQATMNKYISTGVNFPI